MQVFRDWHSSHTRLYNLKRTLINIKKGTYFQYRWWFPSPITSPLTPGELLRTHTSLEQESFISHIINGVITRVVFGEAFFYSLYSSTTHISFCWKYWKVNLHWVLREMTPSKFWRLTDHHIVNMIARMWLFEISILVEAKVRTVTTWAHALWHS